MEIFKPFLGRSYFNKFEKSNNFSRFVCPYNFEVKSQRKIAALTNNEYNVFNLKDDRYGREKFRSWLEGSILVSSKKLIFYIYEMSYKVSGVLYSVLGIAGALKLPEEKDEFVVTCKEAVSGEVEKNFEFLKEFGFSSSPVCAFFEEKDEARFNNIIKNKMLSSYIYKAKHDNVVHKIWKVEEKENIDFLVDFFKDKVYYIFSGVEKFEAAVKYRDYLRENGVELKEDQNYILGLVFLKSSLNMTMLPLHRIVSGVYVFDEQDILKKASKYFDVKRCRTLDSMRNSLFNFRRQNKISFGIYADEKYSIFSLKDEKVLDDCYSDFSPFEKMDSFVLDRLFLNEILNVDKSDISYCNVDLFATNCVDCGDAFFSTYLSAVRSSEFFNILKLKKKLPQRSYSFFPNPVEGLLFYVLRE